MDDFFDEAGFQEFGQLLGDSPPFFISKASHCLSYRL
jgi:hypothetical protein